MFTWIVSLADDPLTVIDETFDQVPSETPLSNTWNLPWAVSLMSNVAAPLTTFGLETVRVDPLRTIVAGVQRSSRASREGRRRGVVIRARLLLAECRRWNMCS